MQLDMFLTNLIVTLAVVTLAMTYLRRATRSVIRELCHTDSAADFWLRSTDVLAYSGALMLVLMFGKFDIADWVESLRVTLVLTFAGLFLTVMFAARNVWQTVKAQPASPEAR